MQREIKFRAWDKEIEQMIQTENCDGDYIWEFNVGQPQIITLKTIDTNPGGMGHVQEDRWMPIEAIFMLYTGLKDKSVKDIYEGDILENDNGVKYVVVWMEQLGGFYLQQPNTQRGKEIISCAASKVVNEPMLLLKEAIVGNIYENPELL